MAVIVMSNGTQGVLGHPNPHVNPHKLNACVCEPFGTGLIDMDKVVHFEIPADNLARAKKFYNTVFGWKMNEMPEMSYVLVGTVEMDENGTPKEPGAINGGILERQEPVKAPVITISVKNIDQAASMIEKNGGKIIRPKMPVGDMGFAAYFKDSEGNVVGLWQNA